MLRRTTTPRKTLRHFLLAALICTGTGSVAGADEMSGETVRIEQTPEEARGWHYTPLQISIFAGAEIFPEDWTVTGLSFNVLHGSQKRVSGIDFGIFNNVTTRMSGLQLGFINIADLDAYGMQAGLINRVGRHLHGAQIGIANRALDKVRGAQIGVMNDAGVVHGLQVGAVNLAESLRGVQIGVANVNRSGKPLTFLPLINLGW